jgi:hypothetical protein
MSEQILVFRILPGEYALTTLKFAGVAFDFKDNPIYLPAQEQLVLRLIDAERVELVREKRSLP